MQNARTPHRFIRFAAAGIVGAAALIAPLAGSASAELGSPREPSTTQYNPFTVKAGTVSSKNGILTIDAATNSNNNIWLVGEAVLGGHLVDDRNAPLIPGAGCITLNDVFTKPVIRCAAASHIVVRLGSGNDEAFVSAGAPVTTDIDGGTGNDTLYAESSSDYITGGNGSDIIRAGGGHDVLIGGTDAGYDSLNGGTGSDDCHQGESYVSCDNGVVNDGDVR